MAHDAQIPFDPKAHHRRSIRVEGFDYAQAGAYFVTVVTHQHDCLFGEIIEDEMRLNRFGIIADECWRAIPGHFQNVDLSAYVVMPNHVHGIIIIRDGRAGDARRGTIYRRETICHCRGTIYRAPTERFGKPVSGSLPTIIRTYKAAVTRRIGREHNATGIWQRNYYEHIIRNENDLQRITNYITANPLRWNDDIENPRNHT